MSILKRTDGGIWLTAKGPVTEGQGLPSAEEGRQRTMSYGILRGHNTDKGDGLLHVRFDSLISHDITYVGIIQTAMASGIHRRISPRSPR